MLTTESPLYDPLHYNKGTVWPFVTGFLALGHYTYDRPWAGYPLVDALARLDSTGRAAATPSCSRARYYRPLDTAVPQQFFATSMLVTPLVAGLLGWDPDAPHGRAAPRAAAAAAVAPPSGVRGLRAGASRFDLSIDDAAVRDDAALRPFARGAPPLVVDLRAAVPPGARDVHVDVDGARVPRSRDGAVSLRLDGPRLVEVRWTGGLSVEPPVADLQPGQADGGLRILAFAAVAEGWKLTVEGRSGTAAAVRLHGERPSHADGATLAAVGDAVTVATIALPASAQPFARAEVLLRR